MSNSSEADKFIGTVRAWDELERRNGSSGILDVCLLDQEEPLIKYDSRAQVLDAFNAIGEAALLSQLEKAKLKAHVTLLRTLMGQRFDFADYIPKTQAISVEAIDEQYLDYRRVALADALSRCGIRFDSNVKTKLAARDHMIPVSDIENTVKQLLEDCQPKLEQLIGQKVEFNVFVEHVQVKEYWRYWLDGNGDKFRLRVNNAEGGIEYSELIQFTFHELLGHAAQLNCWKGNIRNGNLRPAVGLTAVHGPEQFALEGIAHSLPLFVEAEITNHPLVRPRVLLEHFHLLVMNNVHKQVNEGVTLEECIKYGSNWLPYVSNDRWFSQLSSRSINPVFRSYQYVYGLSCDWFIRRSEELNEQDRTQLLKRCYSSSLTFDDLNPKNL